MKKIGAALDVTERQCDFGVTAMEKRTWDACGMPRSTKLRLPDCVMGKATSAQTLMCMLCYVMLFNLAMHRSDVRMSCP